MADHKGAAVGGGGGGHCIAMHAEASTLPAKRAALRSPCQPAGGLLALAFGNTCVGMWKPAPWRATASRRLSSRRWRQPPKSLVAAGVVWHTTTRLTAEFSRPALLQGSGVWGWGSRSSAQASKPAAFVVWGRAEQGSQGG